jgi:hypothetical protein
MIYVKPMKWPRLKQWLDEPGQGLAESLLVLITCVVVVLGIARVVSVTVSRFFEEVARALGLN